MATSLASLGKRFIRANRGASEWLEKRTPHAAYVIHDHYVRRVAHAINGAEGQIRVVDIGAGKNTDFIGLIRNRSQLRLIGVDVSSEELKFNPDLDESIVADVSERIPLAGESVGLVVSQSVLEHLPSVDRLWEETYRVLIPGGQTIHLFPSKRAPFSIANRLLPHRFTVWMLDRSNPEYIGRHGFVTHYDQCTAEAMANSLQRAGFVIEDISVCYYQAPYYSFLFPLYALNVLYERVLVWAGARNLAASVMITARKPISQ